MTDVEPSTQDDDVTDALARRISGGRGTSGVVQARLTTDKRVLARVTDGIYREPSSALRELISNAYDADATEVTIQTDRPRFSSITISDNGNGMSPDVVAHLIEHIGGSAKRSSAGARLGVTDAEDRLLSPVRHRRLIGRIGIGLFSVSQLTHSFQIITKVKDDPWRTVAMVRLRTYDDETVETADDTDYEAGLVSIWSVPAEDVKASGTTIVLTDLQRHTVRTLTDADRWLRVKAGERPPAYHIGHMADERLRLELGASPESVPWKEEDDGQTAFAAIVDSVWDSLRTGSARNPSIDYLFDKYFQTVWEIALAAPLPYVGESPFTLNGDAAQRFVLPAARGGQVEQLTNASFAEFFGIQDDIGQGGQPFRIFFDNLELRRPIKFEDLPSTSHALKRPLIFAGKLREEFPGLEAARSGGPLEFFAYIMWAPKIAPIEHNGALIRVHGASGTLFDRSFLDYGIAELTRLRQLSCEVFVTQGFESALNIDREGFNESHPHARRMTSWLHAAVGRVINTQKSFANSVRRQARAHASSELTSGLQQLAQETWHRKRSDAGQPPPVTWETRQQNAGISDVDVIRLRSDKVLGEERRDSISRTREESQLATIAQILAAFDLLENLSPQEINDLMSTLASAIRQGS